MHESMRNFLRYFMPSLKKCIAPIINRIWLTEKVCLLESELFDYKLLNRSVTTTVLFGTFIYNWNACICMYIIQYIVLLS